MLNPVHETFGNRLRLRVCGLLIEQEQLLMVNHRMQSDVDFWAPPGGGVSFGESAAVSLQREIREETGLETEVGEFLFACEFILAPLHAVELFFQLKRTGGALKTGYDPELRAEDQIIRGVRFMSGPEILKLDPKNRHGIFQFATDPLQIPALRGYFKL